MKITNKEIQALIERYFEVETTLAEEQYLRDYFQKEDIDQDLLMYKEYFNGFQSQENIQAPKRIEEHILKVIQAEESRKKPIKRIRFYLSRVAAFFVLGIGLWFVYTSNTLKNTETAGIDWSKYEVKSEEEALKLTQMAFMKTSFELKKGAGLAETKIHSTKQKWSFLK